MKWDAEVAQAIRKWSPVFGVTIDPALVHAVIQKESSHVKLVTDEAGGHHSYGPMMVYDTTAAGLGIADPTTLKDPATGIWWGVHELADRLRRYPGDTPRAIATYNAFSAQRNAAGRFPNQPYVDVVLGWWKVYGGGAAGAGAAILGLVVGVFLLLRARRRRGSR